MTLGERLKKLRKTRKWTLKETAEKLGLTGHSTYSNWEYDRTEPDLEMLKRIAKLYDVDVQKLLTGKAPEEIDYSYDLEDLLKDKKLKWKNEELTAEEKSKAIEILNILLDGKRGTKL